MVSSRIIRLALAVIVVTATIGIVVAISKKGSKSTTPESVPQNTPGNIDLALNDARFSEMRDGQVVWVLGAGRAEYDKSGETMVLREIKMDFSKTATAGSMTVTAANGEYSAKTQNVKLRGKVRLVTEEGAEFKTESIDYVASRSSFVTSLPVSFVHKRLQLNARGMDMNVGTQLAKFHNPVDAVVEAYQGK